MSVENDEERQRIEKLAYEAADQWAKKIAEWADKHYGHLPKTSRETFLCDDPHQ